MPYSMLDVHLFRYLRHGPIQSHRPIFPRHKKGSLLYCHLSLIFILKKGGSLEKEKVFPGICIGHSGDIAGPGRYFAGNGIQDHSL